MSTYYNEETGRYENFEHLVVTQLRRIHAVISSESAPDDNEEQEETDG